MKGLEELIKSGSAITGSSAGAAAGAALAGPLGVIPGAAVGAACGTLLEKGLEVVGEEFAARVLGPREEQRTGAVIIYAYNEIQERLAAGEQPRNDGFFSQPQPPQTACVEIPFIERPPAYEAIEGILLAVQREHEEKKIPFFAKLLANIYFDQSIDREQSNLLVRISKRISYRQLCILSIFAHAQAFELRKEDYRESVVKDFKLISLLQEICDLWDQGMLNCSGEAHLGLTDVNPSKMNIQGMGILLYNLMGLSRIDSKDIESIIGLLKS